jgi:DNA-binding MurR/RpiR family transcriptional regulator
MRDSLETISASERRVAHALLADYPLLALGTLADWAAQSSVSTPTILRYLSKLGFDSYNDFQSRLKAELSDRLRSPLEKVPLDHRRAPKTRIESFGHAIADNIDETFADLSVAEVEAVIALLCDSRRKVAMVGGRFTDPLARYLAAHLTILRPAISNLTGLPDSWRDKLLDLGKGDVLILFDIRRYTPALMALATQAQARRISLVLITDQWLSPIAKVATHILPARIAVPSRWDSNAALMAIIELLLEGVTDGLGARAHKRISELESLRGQTCPAL